jgi:hypothetical protein
MSIYYSMCACCGIVNVSTDHVALGYIAPQVVRFAARDVYLRHTYIYVYVCVYIFMYMYMYVCVCIHTYIHTY